MLILWLLSGIAAYFIYIVYMAKMRSGYNEAMHIAGLFLVMLGPIGLIGILLVLFGEYLYQKLN